MKYDFSRLQQFDEAVENTNFYRTFEPVDQSQTYNLYELAQIIKQNGDGVSVRWAISEGFRIIGGSLD